MGQYAAILDIGSSKVICLICSPDGKDNIVVHGAGIREYRGYHRGIIEDEPGLAEAIIDAMGQAEDEAKHRVRDISVGVPAPFIKLVLHTGEIKPQARSGRITHGDIDELINASLDFPPPEGYELIHSTPVDFSVDGLVRADMPIGAAAASVSSEVSHIYVQSHFKRLVSDALIKLGLDADMYIGIPLSEGLFVIPEQERLGRAVLIDVGATHTDVCLMKNAALIDFRSIDVGGAHFAGDLSYGLGVEAQVAENIKRRYVYSLDYQDSIDTIRMPGGGTMRVDHRAIQFIIEERTKELSRLIAKALGEMGAKDYRELPIYLAGGGITLMRGSCEFLERSMGVPIQIRMQWMPRLSSPNYASAFSVMDFVMHANDEDNAGRLEGRAGRGALIRRIKEFFFK